MMGPVFAIRLAQERDADALAAIYAPFVRDTCVSFEYEPPGAEEFARRIRRVLERFPWLVCTCGDEIAGYAYASSFHERAAYQWDAELSVYVDARYHRRGVAAALYDRLTALLRAQGVFRLYALLGLPNEQSRAFHAALGFSECCIYRGVGFKHGGWHDMLVMERLLVSLPENPRPPCRFCDLDAAFVRGVLCGAGETGE